MAHPDRLNIAVFIDFDNIEIGVKSTLGEHFDVGTILEALRERGEVVTKIAYADWTRAGEYSRHLTQHAIRLVQRNLTPGGDKNGADINLALDALEMAFTHPHINAYVIVGGDSDFLSLVEKLKQYDKKVFVVGGRAFTSMILQRNCHEFIAYENLVRRPAARGGRPSVPQSTTPIAQAFPIVRRALKILADREVSPQTGLLKSTLLQLDSTFSERNYGASSFLDFVEKLAKAGADFLICPDNTIHQAFDLVEHRSPRPWLHIAREVAAEAKRSGYKRLAVLGTKYLMEGPVYRDALKAAGIGYCVPDPEQRAHINQIIFDELVNGKILARSLAHFVEVIRELKEAGCDAVVLGCTEVPLLVTPDSSPLPTLDSTRLLARAAVRKAVEG